MGDGDGTLDPPGPIPPIPIPGGPITLPIGDDAGWMKGAPPIIKKFVSNPRGLVLGIVVSFILDGVLGIFKPALNALSLGIFGDSITTTTGQLGLADLPLVGLQLLVDAGEAVGELVVGEVAVVPGAGNLPSARFVVEAGLIQDFGNWLSQTANALGLLAWPVAVAGIAGLLVATDRVIDDVGFAIVESIPGIGPLIANVLNK